MLNNKKLVPEKNNGINTLNKNKLIYKFNVFLKSWKYSNKS